MADLKKRTARTAQSTLKVDKGLVGKDQELDVPNRNRWYRVDIDSGMKNDGLQGYKDGVDYSEWVDAWVEFLDGEKVPLDPLEDDGGECFHIKNVQSYVEEVRYRRTLLDMHRSPVSGSAGAPSDERLGGSHKRGARGQTSAAHKGIFVHLKIHDKLDPRSLPPGTILRYADTRTPSTSNADTGNAQLLPSMPTAAPSVGVVE